MQFDLIITYILFPVMVLWGIGLKKEEDRKGLINKDESAFLRGVAALMVVFAHYCLRLEEEQRLSSLMLPFRFLGPLGVAIFFFISGYGLYVSNGFASLNFKFVKKRFLNVYIPYVLMRILFLFFGGILEIDTSSVGAVIAYVLGITVSPSWFVVVIMVMYILYYLISKIKLSDISKIYVLFGALFVFSAIMFFLKGYEHSYWFGNNLVFAIGVIAAYYRSALMGFIKKSYKIILPVTIVLFLVASGLYFVLEDMLLIIDKMFAGILLTALFVLIMYIFNFRSKIMIFTGKYSLYIYITHTNLYRIMGEYLDMKNIINICIYFILVIIVPIVLEWMISRLLKLVDGLFAGKQK